jgi:hypothetical protein
MPRDVDTERLARTAPALASAAIAPVLALALAIAIALAGIVLVLALAGCGGSSGHTIAHIPSEKDASSASGATPESTKAANPQQEALAYAKCMRADGVPGFPDPTPGGGFLFHAGAGMDRSSPAFRAAQAKCRKLMPGGGGPPSTTNPSRQTLARFLRIARCMREHGVPDFPDPRTSVPSNPFGASGGGVISDIEGVILIFASAIEQQSPAFTHAAAACAFPLHNH